MTQYLEANLPNSDELPRHALKFIAALEAETPAIAICTDGSDISIEGYTPSTLSVSEFAVSLRGQTLDCIIVLTNALISDGDKTSLLATLQSNNGVLLIISHD